MKLIKQGVQRLFEKDSETARTVSDILLDLERNGMDAVRKYSQKFDDWSPGSFELAENQVRQIIAGLSEQLIKDTEFCQGNVRQFAEAQLRTLLPLAVEIRPG